MLVTGTVDSMAEFEVEREGLMTTLIQEDYDNRRCELLSNVSFLRRNLNQLLNREDIQAFISPAVRDHLVHCGDTLRAIHCKPEQIVVTGMVAAGKSTFLNNLLNATVLPCANDSTTAIPTHISYAAKYSVTVEYFRQEDVIEMMKRFIASFDDKTSSEHKALKFRLSHIFEPLPDPKEAETLLEEKELFQYIDHEPDVLYEGDEPAEVLAAVTRGATRQQRGDNQVYIAARRICVRGPFPTVPPGVTLVDTPGLGDRAHVKVHRTLNSIHDADQVWHTAGIDVSLSSPENDLVLKEVLVQNQGEISLRVVATKANLYPEDTTDSFKRNLLLLFISSDEEVGRTVDDVADEFDMYGLDNFSPEVIDRAQARVESEAIFDMVGLGDDPHFLVFRDALLNAGQAKLDELSRAEQDLRDVRARIQQIGVTDLYNGHVDRVTRLQERFNTGMDNIRAREVIRNANDHHIRHRQLMGNQFHGFFHSTITAAMDTVRQGVFSGKGKVYKSTVDVNRDIAEVWVRDTMRVVNALRALSNQTLNDMERLQELNPPEELLRLSRGNCRMLRRAFSDFFNTTVREGVPAIIQQRLLRQNVYTYCGRNFFPIEPEFGDVMAHLITNFQAGLGGLSATMNAMCGAFLAFGRPQDELPPTLRAALDAILNPPPVICTVPPDNVHPKEDLICAICFELFKDPVQILCSHVFCESCINNWLCNERVQCPFRCDVAVFGQPVRPRVDLLPSIKYYRELERLERARDLEGDGVGELSPVQETWYNAVWRVHSEMWRERILQQETA